MRKTTTITKIALGALCLFGTALTASADIGTATVGSQFELKRNDIFSFTPESSGTLTATLNPGMFDQGSGPVNILFKNYTGEGNTDSNYVGENEVTLINYSPSGEFVQVTSMSWYVEQSQTYYFVSNTETSVTLQLEAGTVNPTPQETVVEITLGGPSVTLGGSNKKGKLVVEEEGVLKVTAASWPSVNASYAGFLTNESGQEFDSTVATFQGWTGEEPYYALFDLTPGTYYVNYDSFDTCVFTFEFTSADDQTLALIYVYPDAGQSFTTNDNALVSGCVIGFEPSNVTKGTAELQYTDNSDQPQTVPLTIDTAGNNISVGGGNEEQQEIYNNLNNIKPGTQFYVVLKDFKYNDIPVTELGDQLQSVSDYIKIEDGTITITYNMPATIFALQNQNWQSSLASYYAPGNEAGIATLTYNLPVKQVGTALLAFTANYNPQSTAEATYATYDIPVIIDQENPNVVKLNFTGQDFTKLPLYSSPSAVSVFINGVYATDNQTVDQILKTGWTYTANPADALSTPMNTKGTLVSPAGYCTAPENAVIEWEGETISLTSADGYARIQGQSGAPVQCSLSLENNQLTVVVPSSVKGTGLFTITLPANTVKNAEGNTNEEETFTYTVISTVQGSWSGIENAGEYLAADLLSVALNFSGDLTKGYTTEKVTLVQNQNTTELDPSISGGAINFNLSNLEDGTYTLNVPEGYVWITEGSITNAASSVIFTIASAEENFENGTVMVPEDGNKYVLVLETVSVQWEGEINMVGTSVVVNVSVDGEEPEAVDAELVYDDAEEITTLTVDMSEYADQYGAYIVEIPAGVLEDGEGKVNLRQLVAFSYLAADNNFSVTPDPDGEVDIESFENGITVTWENATSVELNESCFATVEWANSNSQIYVLETKPNAVWIPGGALEPGEYTLVIPATKVIIDGKALNEEIKVTYTVDDSSGISAINAAVEEGNVYTINGLKVKNTDTLQKGIYIINGKKVIIRK